MSERAYYLDEGLPAPVPEADGLSKPYWEGLQNNEILVQRCDKCQNWQWGPEWMCHKCHSFDLTWTKVEGNGHIYSWERVWHPVHSALSNQGPYIVVLVELRDYGNIRMIGNLLGDPEQEVRISAPVNAVFEHHKDNDPAFTLLQWQYS
jgi:uncharacterized OB-fold protein